MSKTKAERELIRSLKQQLINKHFKRRQSADGLVYWYERVHKKYLLYYADIEGENYHVAVKHAGQVVILKKFPVLADMLDSYKKAKMTI